MNRKRKPEKNPFLRLQHVLQILQVPFAYMGPWAEARSNEFFGSIKLARRHTEDRWNYKFLYPTLTGCCMDHVPVMFIEDEVECRRLNQKAFEESLMIPAYVEKYGMGPIFVTDTCPELPPWSGAFVQALKVATPCPSCNHKGHWLLDKCYEVVAPRTPCGCTAPQ